MSFLSPLFLVGLLAAAIPVAIHLIRREKPPRVMFGTLRFLKQTTKKLVLFQQIQQWLLLLLRAALICLLVLAFARPLFHQTSLTQLIDAEPESVVILLDGSLSMQYDDRFSRAREQALGVLNELDPGDEAAVLSFANGTRRVRELSTGINDLRRFISDLPEPGFERARFLPALSLADDLLRQARHDKRRIVMISDFQASGMSGADAEISSDWILAPGVAFNAIDVGIERSSNLSLTDVRSPQQVMETDEEVQILARVRSTGSVFLERGELSLSLDNEMLGRHAVELTGRSESVQTLSAALDASGSHAGELILAGDDFAVDNHWYFTLNVLPRMRVLVVNGAPSGDWYDDGAHWFNLALEGAEASPFSVNTINLADFDPALLTENDAVALLNVFSLSTAQQRSLQEFVERGGALLLAPGDRVEAQVFNAQLGSLSPLSLQRPQQLNDSDYLLIADIDRRHPAMRALDVDWGARFQGYWETDRQTEEQAEVLMRFDSGDPLLAERRIGDGHTMLITTSLDLGWSNFPLQGLYLPFIHEVLTYMIQPPVREQAYQVGDMIDMSPLFDAERGELEFREPDGQTVSISADNPYYQARMPGFITEMDSGHRYAVNIEPEAAILERLDVAELTDRIINPETTPEISERVRTAQLVAEMEQPQRLWWWILLLVLLLMLTEAWIANRTYR